MIIGTISDHVSGDTFLGANLVFQDALGQPLSILGATISLKSIRDRNELSTSNGKIVITNGAGGLASIPEQVISWTSATYTCRLSVTFANGKKRTYGIYTWNIL